MPLIESKALTEIYEIRRRINEKIMDMSPEEQTAYFRRNAEAALAGRRVKTVTAPRLEEAKEGETPWSAEDREVSRR